MNAVSIENVSKRFLLKKDQPRNLADGLRGLMRRADRDEFWALKDVSIEVNCGEALGIIGHNGAGKSTMLKLLTHIMEPTSGRIRTRGRISALIEVGAGFHPEMTGRENIYLNGSILGMTRREITSKLDDIVAFAELEKFIDMPVKRYSSGMYARLGFSVAAHVDPDVLVVDEVLSVGDAAFQKRCIDHMQKLRHSGCTILFVSHNLQAVATMCDRGAVLAMGNLHYLGPVAEAVAQYTSITYKASSMPADRMFDNSMLIAKTFSGTCRIERALLLNADDHETSVVRSGSAVKIRLEILFEEDAVSPIPSFFIRRSDGVVVYDTTANWLGVDCGSFRCGDRASFDFSLDYIPLKSGDYSITAELAYADLTMYYDCKPNVITFNVFDSAISQGMLELPTRLTISPGVSSQ